MGLYDLLVAAVAALGYGIGRKRGLLWQLSGVATLLVGGACATILCRPLGEQLFPGILGRFLAWVVIYAVVAICLYLISLRLKHRIEEMELEELDERFGGMLGAFKALLVFAVITLVAVGISSRLAGAVRASASGRALHVLVEELRPYLPEQFSDALNPSPLGPDGAQAPPSGAVSPTPARSPSPAATQRPPSQRPVPAPTGRPAPPPSPRPSVALPDELPAPPPQPSPSSSPVPDPFDPSDVPQDPLAPPQGSR
ncbi:MAG: CvpA family protein [Planctomycetota bacterium]